MACSSGAFSGSSIPSDHDDQYQHIMNERKRKRMLSNRESARRCRMRKKQHLGDLTNQASLLRNVNNELVSRINMIIQHYLHVEAENSVLRAQMAELSHRLDALDEIINSTKYGFFGHESSSDVSFFVEAWNGTNQAWA